MLSFVVGMHGHGSTRMYLRRLIVSIAVVYGASALVLIKKAPIGDVMFAPWTFVAAMLDLDIHVAICVAATFMILALAAMHRVASILAVLWFVANALYGLFFLIVADPYRSA